MFPKDYIHIKYVCFICWRTVRSYVGLYIAKDAFENVRNTNSCIKHELSGCQYEYELSVSFGRLLRYANVALALSSPCTISTCRDCGSLILTPGSTRGCMSLSNSTLSFMIPSEALHQCSLQHYISKVNVKIGGVLSFNIE